ncbi:hypothetical protein F4780DRAFT_423184 [Xylariomycetidae sp. FL0641]|nr:hypothetical protein F4780DRAFT_423184 [Xylariomycetidae sp. FL0641]
MRGLVSCLQGAFLKLFFLLSKRCRPPGAFELDFENRSIQCYCQRGLAEATVSSFPADLKPLRKPVEQMLNQFLPKLLSRQSGRLSESVLGASRFAIFLFPLLYVK